MSKRLYYILLVFIIAIPVFSQISPGKLSHYHEKLEGISNCTKCHELGEAPTPEKCFVCHQSLQLRVKSGLGYHHSPEVKSSQCSSCHSEHNGKEFEPVHWKNGKEKFDHNLTGYRMEGKHIGLSCEKCHRKDFIAVQSVLQDKNVDISRTFLGLNPACGNCHNDEHRGQLSKDCLKCHNYTSWKPASGFKHDNAYYKLTGKHKQTACEKCHPALNAAASDSKKIGKKDNALKYSKYKGLDFNNCTPCHKDVHRGKFGPDCKKCHTTDSFNTIASAGAFNHSMTNYPLQGKHQSVPCEKCHTSGDMTAKLKYQRCLDCHKDSHKGQFASRKDSGDCVSCHSLDGFKPSLYSLENHFNSGYPLAGSHLAVPCIECHKMAIDAAGSEYMQFTFPDTTCSGCHPDIHKGEAARWLENNTCSFCHTVDSWKKASFDHNLSRFKLEGKHRNVQCGKCHRNQNKTVLKPLSAVCSECHKDIHYGQFTENVGGIPRIHCEKCHSESAWKPVSFDHNKSSRFLLTGSHANIPCGKCHKTESTPAGERFIKYKPLGTACAECHGKTEMKNP